MRYFNTFSLLILCSILFSCKNSPPEEEITWKHTDNTLRVRLSAAPQTLNPYLIRSSYEADVVANFFQGLMDFDPSTYELKPVLAVGDPSISDLENGGKKYTFQINEKAVWDDGSPVTGHDVAFTFKCIFNPKLPTFMYRAFLDFVKNVEVEEANPQVFSVLTDKDYFLALSTMTTVSILPKHIYDPEGLLENISLSDLTNGAKTKELENNENVQRFAEAFMSPKFGSETVSGSGPYRLAQWAAGERAVLAKKANWWGTKVSDNAMLVAHPDTISFIAIADPVAAINALKDEQIDAAYELDAEQFMELKNEDYLRPIYDFYTPPSFTYFATLINNRNPKLQDNRTRRALAHLVNMEEVIGTLYNGLGERMVGPFFPDKKYFDKELKPINYDVAKAQSLLKEAGWEDTNQNGTVDKNLNGELTELELEYLYSPTSNYQDNFTELMKNNAAKAGVAIKRIALDAKVINQRRQSGEYELVGWGTRGFPQPDDPKQLWHTDGAQQGGSNYARFGNAKSDELIEAIRAAPGEATRNKLYQQFQRLVYDEQPMIFHFSPMEKVVVHDRFEPAISRIGISFRRFKLRQPKS